MAIAVTEAHWKNAAAIQESSTLPNAPLRTRIATTLLIIWLLPDGVNAATLDSTDFMGLSLEELAGIDVKVVSLLPTTAAQAGSTVDVVHERDWQKRGARRMLDAVSGLPATVALPMHLGADALVIRGYGGVSSYSGTALQWDGVPLNDLFAGSGFINLPNLNLGTLSRIELIRGPGSALHGSDAYHGVLALHAFESDRDTRSAGAEIASNGYHEINGRISRQAFQDSRLNIALAGNGQPDQDRHYNFVDPASAQQLRGERDNEYTTQTVAVKLASDEDATWAYDAGMYAHHYEADDFSGLGTVLSGVSDISSTKTDFLASRFNLTRNFNTRQSLEMQSYAWHVDNDAETRLQTPSAVIERLVPRQQQRYGVRFIYRDADSFDNTRWALMGGADKLEVTDADIINTVAGGAPAAGFEHPASGAHRTVRQITLEADTRWANDVWHLVYGARLDDYSDVGSHISPRLGLITAPQSDITIKLLYGNAFHAPSTLELYGSTGAAEGNPDLAPEILDSYELVLIKRGKQWHAQMELFHSRWRDAIVSVARETTPSTFTFANQDRSTAQGVSLSAAWEYSPWTVRCNGTYAESKNTSTDEDYGLFPALTLNLGIGYDFYRHATQIFVNQIYYNHADDVLEPEAGFNAQKLPVYSRTDLTVTHRISQGLEIFSAARNLLDRNNRLPSAMGSRNGIPDERASVSAGFRYNF